MNNHYQVKLVGGSSDAKVVQVNNLEVELTMPPINGVRGTYGFSGDIEEVDSEPLYIFRLKNQESE
jgi:hypothetical protein